MKNLFNSVILTWGTILRITKMQRLILIGSTILPAGSLILIFSPYARRIIQKLEKGKTSTTFGNLLSEDEMWEDLIQRNEGKYINRNEKQNRDARISSSNAVRRGESSEDFIFWEQ